MARWTTHASTRRLVEFRSLLPWLCGTRTPSAPSTPSALAAVLLLGTLAACSPSPPPSASTVAPPARTAAPADTTAPAAPRTVTAAPVSRPPAASISSPAATDPASQPAQAEVRGACERTLSAYPLLEPGAKGAAVRALQCSLNDADYGPVLVDGVYGRQTRAAVTRVESGFEGAPPHPGRIDRGMWVLLISRSMGTATLREGARGPEVTTLQRALRAAGGRLAVDGVFGPQTTGVVKQFQKANSITVDGVVGEETYFFLKSGGVIDRS